MQNIIFYCNWGPSSEELLLRYKQMTKNNSGIWNSLIGTTNINKANIIIFIEGIPNNFNLKLLKDKNIICFPREPFGKKNWEQFKLPLGHTYDNYIHVVTNPHFINKDYDFLSNLSYIEHKNKLSAIIFNKNNSVGYQLRRNLLINFTKKYPRICDVYGAGWNNELGDSYKGELDGYHKTLQQRILNIMD